jgi:hypothetical protein
MKLMVSQPDLQEITEVLNAEKVDYSVRYTETVREIGTGSFNLTEVAANLPEVTVPATYRSSTSDVRAFRLPSGKLILTDLEGNLEQVTTPPPTH